LEISESIIQKIHNVNIKSIKFSMSIKYELNSNESWYTNIVPKGTIDFSLSSLFGVEPGIDGDWEC
jgi:hypothetical protein